MRHLRIPSSVRGDNGDNFDQKKAIYEVSTSFDCAWRSVQRLANGDVYTDIRGGGFSAN